VSKQSKPRIEYLDFYRAFAILAVIMIHVTSFPLIQTDQSSWQHFFYFILNSSSQFAVPAFLFLSGLVLFYNYYNTGHGMGWVATFYRKRLLYIVIPYFVWSLFYYLFLQYAAHGNALLNMDQFFVKLVTGNNYAHLYFFIIIIQFYVLFPALVHFVQRYKLEKWLILFAFVFHVIFFIINNHWLHFQRTGVLFFSYFLQFCAGAYAGMNFEHASRTLVRYKWVIAVLYVGGSLLYIFAGKIYYQWIPALLPYKPYLNQIIYFGFTLAASAFLLVLANRIYRADSMAWAKRALNSIGTATFVIFLVHPFFLALWRRYVVDQFGAYYHYLTLLGFLVVLLCSWGSYLLLAKYKRYTWWITGK